MFLESVFLIIFVCSFGGVLLILIRKMPALAELPKNGSTGFKQHHAVSVVENKIKGIVVFFEKQILLHKLLSWLRRIVIKMEAQIDRLLRGIRKKAQQVDKDTKK